MITIRYNIFVLKINVEYRIISLEEPKTESTKYSNIKSCSLNTHVKERLEE